MEEYPNNSNKYKEFSEEKNKKNIEPIQLSGPVKRKKEGSFKRFVTSFISDDVDSTIGDIVPNVVVPGVQKLVYNTVNYFMELIFPGVTSNKRSSSDSSSRISYRSYYDRTNEQAPSAPSIVKGYDDIVLSTKGEAEEILDKLTEILSYYKIVSVADYYELLGIKHDYTLNDYGWDNLSSATIVHTRDGYMVKLPKVIPLK